jgi:hypothetical protein
MVKPIVFMIAIVMVGVIFFVLVIPAEDQLMDSWVSTGPNITLDEWREVFRLWAQFGIAVALVAALFWFLCGQWIFGMTRWIKANNKRWVWLGFLLVAVLAVVPGMVLTPAVQEWGRLAWVCYVVNNLGLFYLATLLFSPSSFKYVPWLAMRVRYW